MGLGAFGVLLNVRLWTRTVASDIPQQTGQATENLLQWKVIRSAGDRAVMVAGGSYHLALNARGSSLKVELEGVEPVSGQLPFQLSGKQVGLFCQSKDKIHVGNFRVETTKPTAFVVMQFSPPEYEELFNDVIVPVCEKMGIEPFRANQAYSCPAW